MIGQLTGKPKEGIDGFIILDVNGIGYQVRVALNQYSKILAQEKVILFIYTHVREEAFDLYGFTNKEDLRLFKLLINVPGIGPKTAINILAAGSDGIKKAVINSDTSFFTQIPKIGTKNAQKIIIELKPKIGSVRELDLSGKEKEEEKELIDVLTGMGFSQKESYQAIKKIPKEISKLEEKIRYALKLLK